MTEINYDLLSELRTRSHPLLNDHVCDCDSYCGEIVQEARSSHHLLDMAGIPRGTGYAQDLDSRTYLAVTEISDLRERLTRIATWHSRETGPAGTVGDFCIECGSRWPCDTWRMAHEDPTEPDDARPVKPWSLRTAR